MLAFISKYGHWLEIGLAVIMLVLAAGGGYRYAHKDVAVVQGKLDSALKDVAQRDAILKDVNDQTAAAKKQEEAAEARASKAEADLDTFKKTQTKVETIFVTKTTELTKQPECAVLKEHLCPAAMGY